MDNRDLFQTVLASVKTGLGIPAAVIAGGAVRDDFYRKPIKDLDVWVPLSMLPDSDTLDTAGWWATGDAGTSEYPTDLGMIQAVYESDRFDLPVQLIGVDDAGLLTDDWKLRDAVLPTFDFGLCMASVMYADAPRYHREFLAAHEFKTFRPQPWLGNAAMAWNLPRVKERYRRLKTKYPDHTLGDVPPPLTTAMFDGSEPFPFTEDDLLREL